MVDKKRCYMYRLYGGTGNTIKYPWNYFCLRLVFIYPSQTPKFVNSQSQNYEDFYLSEAVIHHDLV